MWRTIPNPCIIRLAWYCRFLSIIFKARVSRWAVVFINSFFFDEILVLTAELCNRRRILAHAECTEHPWPILWRYTIAVSTNLKSLDIGYPFPICSLPTHQQMCCVGFIIQWRWTEKPYQSALFDIFDICCMLHSGI